MTQSWRDRMRAHSDRINFHPERQVTCQIVTEIKLPCLVVICGSVCVILKVEVVSCYICVLSIFSLFSRCPGIILRVSHLCVFSVLLMLSVYCWIVLPPVLSLFFLCSSQIREDGTFVFTEHQLQCGRFFLALATVFLGRKV